MSRRCLNLCCCLAVAISACAIGAHAQFELPDEIFQRTVLIRYQDHQSTGFKFDQNGHIYIVTTRHFASELPSNEISVQMWQKQEWIDLPTLGIIYPEAKDVDLAILKTSERIEKPFKVVKSSETLTTGRQVWLMGKPHAIRLPVVPLKPPQTARLNLGDVPFVKLGTVSEIVPDRSDSYQISYQGQYEPRIGGGPIVSWSPVHRDYEILGVIKRDPKVTDRDSIDLNVAKQPYETRFLRGYSIDYVVEAIKKAEQEPK